MQRKLHHWAVDETDRCFNDLYNLVYDPAFLTFAWEPVRTNKGARSVGTDGIAPRSLGPGGGRTASAAQSGAQGAGVPAGSAAGGDDPKGERQAPPPGIATVADRVVQASLKLVLEPICEADFHPCSYGFRPRRRAKDAIARHDSPRTVAIRLEGADPR